MPRAHNQTAPTQSTSLEAPRNSQPPTPSRSAATVRESPAPANPSPSHFPQESAPWNPSEPPGRPLRKLFSTPPNARSSAQNALRWQPSAAGFHFPAQARQVSKDSPRVGAAPPVRIPSPGNPPRPTAKPRPPFSPYLAPKPSARAHRTLPVATISEKKDHLHREAPRPATANPASR